jgi:hypothetical protein
MCLNEFYSIFRIGTLLSATFPIQNGLKLGDALTPLFFKITLENAKRKAKENQLGLNMNSTRQLLVNTDDVNLLGDNINTEKSTCKYMFRRFVSSGI